MGGASAYKMGGVSSTRVNSSALNLTRTMSHARQVGGTVQPRERPSAASSAFTRCRDSVLRSRISVRSSCYLIYGLFIVVNRHMVSRWGQARLYFSYFIHRVPPGLLSVGRSVGDILLLVTRAGVLLTKDSCSYTLVTLLTYFMRPIPLVPRSHVV